MFYVSVTEDSHHSERSRRQRPATARARRQRRRQNNNRCPCHCKHSNEKYSESCENSTEYLNNEERSQKIDNSSMNTNYLESLIDFQSQNLAKGENQNEDISCETMNEKDKLQTFKQVHVNPREQVKCPGTARNPIMETMHFYTVYGAMLCHYNQCSEPQVGVSQTTSEETRLIVQHVESGSPAAVAGVVKGEYCSFVYS